MHHRSVSARLEDPEARPYFLWDEDLSVREFCARLAGSDREERLRLLAKLLREARDTDVWRFVTPAEVARDLPDLRPHLGRRRGFWDFLIQGWQQDGLL